MSHRLAALAVAVFALAGTDSAFASESVVLVREGADVRAEASRAGASGARVYPHVGAFVASLNESQLGRFELGP